MSVFKVGDKVMLKETSGWVTAGSHSLSSTNPLNMIGEVINPNRDHELDVEVRWSNGMLNQYNRADLIQVEQEAPKPATKKEPKLSYKKYKDVYEDYFKVDTKCSKISVSFEPMTQTDGGDSPAVLLDAEAVKRLRKQLKNWLDANGHND